MKDYGPAFIESNKGWGAYGLLQEIPPAAPPTGNGSLPHATLPTGGGLPPNPTGAASSSSSRSAGGRWRRRLACTGEGVRRPAGRRMNRSLPRAWRASSKSCGTSYIFPSVQIIRVRDVCYVKKLSPFLFVKRSIQLMYPCVIWLGDSLIKTEFNWGLLLLRSVNITTFIITSNLPTILRVLNVY